jgi:hypothetical protein
MTAQYRQKGISLVVSVALEVHRAIAMLEKGEYVQRSVTDILELLESFARLLGLQIGREPRKDLYPWTLIEEEQVRGWAAVEFDKVFHLGKELGIGDVQKVARLMRLQPVTVQDAM